MIPLFKEGQKGGTYINGLSRFGHEFPTLRNELFTHAEWKQLKELGQVWHQTFGKIAPSKGQNSKTSFFVLIADKLPFVGKALNIAKQFIPINVNQQKIANEIQKGTSGKGNLNPIVKGLSIAIPPTISPKD
jgi:hypothetical protein